jgi:benzoyl-CoA reductase subunit C
MSATLTNLNILLEDPYLRARELKSQGRKVIGVSPMYFPVVMIHAGGGVPVVLQESAEPVTTGMAHLYPFFCGFTRSTVDMGVRGKLDVFDAMVLGDLCIQLRHMFKTLKRQMPATSFVYMQWPLEISERFHGTVRDRLARCREALEEVLGGEIEEAALRDSIALFNRNRALLRRVFELCRTKPGIMKARDLMALVQAGMLMPKEEHCRLLEELLPDLERRPATREKVVKVYLAGHLCMSVKVEILDLIEDLGAHVVWDDLFVGYRYAASEVSQDLPPMEALTQHYFNLGIPCPTRWEPKSGWSDYLTARVRESGAQGTVILMVKQCGPMLLYYPWLKEVLTGSGIPQTLIVTEHEMISLEGTRTRLQAFMEMLGKGV